MLKQLYIHNFKDSCGEYVVGAGVTISAPIKNNNAVILISKRHKFRFQKIENNANAATGDHFFVCY